MYELFNELFSDKKDGVIFNCFGIWHILYMLIIFVCIIALVVLFKNKSQNVKNKAINMTINIAFGLYILDFFLMPFAYGKIDIEKLPFHICTFTCVMCFLSRHNKFLSKYTLQFALLGLIGNIIYVIYPAGVGWYQINPLSYRVIQTLLFHGLMTAYGIFVLCFETKELKIRNSYKELIIIVLLTLWSMVGNYLYNSSIKDYSFTYNWFFTLQDPFYILPSNIALFIMPIVMIVVIYIVDLLVYLTYNLLMKKKRRNK